MNRQLSKNLIKIVFYILSQQPFTSFVESIKNAEDNSLIGIKQHFCTVFFSPESYQPNIPVKSKRGKKKLSTASIGVITQDFPHLDDCARIKTPVTLLCRYSVKRPEMHCHITIPANNIQLQAAVLHTNKNPNEDTFDAFIFSFFVLLTSPQITEDLL